MFPAQELLREPKPEDLTYRSKSLLGIPKQIPMFTTEGAKRIFIELEDSPKDARECAKKWEDLVSDITTIVKWSIEGKTGKAREEAFILAAWGALWSNFSVKFEHPERPFLFDTADNNIFNCDSSAFLMYDVGKKLGIKLNFVESTPPRGESRSFHVFLKTEHFFFETTSGGYSDIKENLYKYDSIRVLEENQIHHGSYWALGVYYMKESDYKEAAHYLTKAIELVPDDSRLYVLLAEVHFLSGDYNQSIKDLDIAIKHLRSRPGDLDPETSFVYMTKGLTHLQVKKYDEALAAFKEARKFDFTTLEPALREAEVYALQGKFEEALEGYDHVVELSSKWPDRFKKGDWKNISGDRKELIIDWAIRALKGRGDIYFLQGRYEKAAEDFIKALKINENNPDVHESLGLAYDKLGKHDEAFEQFEIAKKLRKQ